MLVTLGVSMYNKKELARKMQALKKGDKSAFDYIYDSTNRLVYYVIYSILKDAFLSEDIMQNTYLKVYANIDKYQHNEPRAWIITIARNLAINEYHRRKRIDIVDVERIDVMQANQNTDTPLIDLAARNLSQEEFLVVMLCVVDGYRRREVAQIIKKSTSGVTWILNNSLEKLRMLVKEDENET